MVFVKMAGQAQLYAENMGLPLPMCGLQDWIVNPAPPSFEVDSCFNLQNPSRYSTVPFHLQQNANNLASSSDTFVSTTLSQSLDAPLEMQTQEPDCVLQLQNERLRYALREQRQRQLTILLKCMESKALYLMRRKQEDLARAKMKTMELEASMRKVAFENQSWQIVAKAKEAMVMDLTNILKQVKVSNITDDEGSLFIDQQEGEVNEKSNDNKMGCKHCNSSSLCVVFLPCRHLCSCNSCEAFLDSCPVCKAIKEASITSVTIMV